MSTMQFFTWGLVWPSLLLDALQTVSVILVWLVQRSEPQEKLFTSSLKAQYFLLLPCMWTVSVAGAHSCLGSRASQLSFLLFCGRAFSCPQSCGTCAGCSRRNHGLAPAGKDCPIGFLKANSRYIIIPSCSLLYSSRDKELLKQNKNISTVPLLSLTKLTIPNM